MEVDGGVLAGARRQHVPARAAFVGIAGGAFDAFELGNGGHAPLAGLVGLRLDGAGHPHAIERDGGFARGEGAGKLGPAGGGLDDVGLPDLGVGLERGLERLVVDDVEAAVGVEIPGTGRLHHDADDAVAIEVEGDEVMAGLGLHVLADLDELVPGQVLQVGGLVAGLFEVVGTVEQARDARVEGQRVGLAVIGGGRDLVGREGGHIDRVGQRHEGARERLQVFLRHVILDQHDVGQAGGVAGEQLGLQLLTDIVLLHAVVDLDVDVRMRRGIARRGFLHGGAVEIGIPGPDGDVDGHGRGHGEHGDAGSCCYGERVAPARCGGSHVVLPFSFGSPWASVVRICDQRRMSATKGNSTWRKVR